MDALTLVETAKTAVGRDEASCGSYLTETGPSAEPVGRAWRRPRAKSGADRRGVWRRSGATLPHRQADQPG
jgi:hypothetical protein